ncbi:MAG: hypothetical protein BGN83_16245 [Rhizobium sp. 63-7]|nr:MAG: hypothetical protein BGN83_16245 [Rhizobium sp. 63-7]
MTSVPPHLIQELRKQVVYAIADYKSYEVPALCKQLGLADGTDEEAFRSKAKYAQVRLNGIDGAAVLVVARKLLSETTSYPLAECVAHIDELGHPLVTELTRRRLMTVFERRPLATQMEEIDLIRKVWPVESMPSPYGGGDLLDAILQHTVRNYDWENADLLVNLGFLTCSQTQLFKFLKEVTGPIAQKTDEQASLVADLNKHLEHDGYRLSVVGKLSGIPIYEVTKRTIGSPADQGISEALKAFDPNDVHARWVAAVERRIDDPRGAITLARTLLEDVCKWILNEAGESYQDKDDLPVLYRKLAKALRLAPDDHTEQTFKQLLGSCQQIVELLGSLRSKLGDAHSPGPKKAKPQPRHAELAVNLSGTMATFLVDTWKARQSEANFTDSKQ